MLLEVISDLVKYSNYTENARTREINAKADNYRSCLRPHFYPHLLVFCTGILLIYMNLVSTGSWLLGTGWTVQKLPEAPFLLQVCHQH